MLSRILEPEAMDDAAEAREYDAMDHTSVNRAFVDDLLQLLRETAPADIPPAHRPTHGDPFMMIDVGTGTARIPIELAMRFASGDTQELLAGLGAGRLRVTAADLSGEMLELAERNLREAGIAHPPSDPGRPRAERFAGWPVNDVSTPIAGVALLLSDGKGTGMSDRSFDAVVSNSLIHHIPEPITVFREFARLTRPGGWVFLRDLRRPDSQTELDRLVTLHAADASESQRLLFAASLRAALTLDEVNALCREVGWSAAARATSDRHWTVSLRLPVPSGTDS
jgi:ubiquinone/menaquinone biosynthesis C-methylase UbiE